MGGLSNLKPFQPGQSGNPAGRRKGSRNKLGEQFIEALQQDFEANGVAAIAKVRDEKPDQYLKVIASLMPKDVNLNVNNMDELTDDQLVERIRKLDSVIRPFLDIEGEGGVGGGAGSETAH